MKAGLGSISVMGIARYPASEIAEQSAPTHLNPRSLAYLAIAVAILCASCVFFVLCQRDNSWFLAISNPLHPATPKLSEQPASVPVPRDAMPPSADAISTRSATDSGSTQQARLYPENPNSQRVQFRLRRSRFFQTVGPLKLRLARTNLRRSNADLSLMVDGHRLDRQVALDKPVQVTQPNGSGKSFEIVLSGLSREGVSGYVTESP